MAYKRPIPSRNPPAPLNRKRPQFFPRLNIRLRPSRFPGVIIHIRIFKQVVLSNWAEETLDSDSRIISVNCPKLQ
jgi:hypothetical protein